MKFGIIKTTMALVITGLAVTASQTTGGAGAATSPRGLVAPITRSITQTARADVSLATGKWRHPANLPVRAEQPELSPAYENARSSITGTASLPVILADFSDNPAESTLHTPTAFQNMLFQDGYPYGAGSLRDYYQDQSGGQFDVTGQVSNWVRLPKAYSTYVGSKYGYQSTEPNDFTLVRDAVAAADSTMNFCKSDTDGDGYVDALVIVHAGPGAEEGKESSRIWSVRWELPTVYTTQDVCANGARVKIKDFTLEPEEFVNGNFTAPGAPARMIAIGVFAHEFGHALGLPDLYDTDYSSDGGVGPWDLMAGGSWGFDGTKPWLPTPFSAWSKSKLGWLTPQNVTQNRLGVSIPSADAPFAGRFTGVYRVAPGGSATSKEYFLVENRQPVGWARDFPIGGLAIWQIDDSVDGNANDAHRQVELLLADGAGIFNELGDAGDLFPGISANRAIDSSTNPNTLAYSGAATGVAVRAIGDAGTTTRADLIVSTAAAADTTPPTVTIPTEQIEGQVTNTLVPVRFAWSASDPSGIASANVWIKDNGTWYDKGNYSPSTTSLAFNLTIGRSYQVGVRAKDGAGNWSDYFYGSSFTVETKDDKAFNLTGTGWTRYTWADAYGGTYITSSTAGHSVVVSFTGREVALVAPKYATAGRAFVYCDGSYVGIADLKAASLSSRVGAFRCEWATSGSHTMKLVLEGTSGRPRFDVDAFAILR